MDQYWTEVGIREEYEAYLDSIEKGDRVKASDMIESKYLKQSDIDGEVIVTIQKVGRGNVAQEDQPEDLKWMIRFTEFKKPMVLNTTNIQLLEKACGEDVDGWSGQEVILYVDPNVSFGGKLTGGIRVKSAKPAAAPKRASAMADLDSDVPF